MSAEKRARVGSAGGRARADLPAPELARINAAGGRAINSPVGLARRIGKKWPDLTDAERLEVLDVLAAAGLPLARRRR